jgi:hypothetical protein
MSNEPIKDEYKGLPSLLHAVRWSQRLLAIIAEVLILVAFAMSGMDVSLGGVMASIPLLKILWAAMFALGIDTAFALSWVRVRQCMVRRQWGAFSANLLLALAMSVIVFQPISIQLLQQSLNVNFDQAVANLGVNIVLLTYARSGVAIFLGAILAMTNVEGGTAQQLSSKPNRSVKLFNRLAMLVSGKQRAAHQVVIKEDNTAQLPAPTEQADETAYDTPAKRQAKVSELDLKDLSNYDKVVSVLELFPDLSDRELGKLTGMSAVTAKKHRENVKRQS